MANPEFDLCVIGGGAAGLVVAAGGAALGAKVALIEKRALGGDCLRYGCVPSKTLLHSAKVAHTLRDADRFGIVAGNPKIKLDAAMRRVAEVIKTLEPNDSPERFRGFGVDVIFGAGQFTDSATFEIDGRKITAKNFVIATGSRPGVPSLPGLDSVPFLTNETVFELEQPVPSLIVLGAGPIGVEMAQAFSRLGARVQLVDVGGQILPKEDADVAEVVARQLSHEGIAIHLGVKPLRIEPKAGGGRLWLEQNGTELKLDTSHVLVAAGRRLNIDNLGLESAGVKVEMGRIVSDERLRTSNKRIYVCGDAVGSYQFTHVAEHHAGVVLRNALFHLPAKIERKTIPWCTFTDPELARVGLSETEAHTKGIDFQAFTFPFAEVDRAQTDAETTGFAKILTGRRGRLLGAAIVGAHAGELIHEYALAIAKGMTASDLSSVIHIYPTLAQINRRVAEQRRKQSLTPRTKRWMQRLFRLRGAR